MLICNIKKEKEIQKGWLYEKMLLTQICEERKRKGRKKNICSENI